MAIHMYGAALSILGGEIWSEVALGMLSCLWHLCHAFPIGSILCYLFLYGYGHEFRVFSFDKHVVVDCEHYGSMDILCG